VRVHDVRERHVNPEGSEQPQERPEARAVAGRGDAQCVGAAQAAQCGGKALQGCGTHSVPDFRAAGLMIPIGTLAYAQLRPGCATECAPGDETVAGRDESARWRARSVILGKYAHFSAAYAPRSRAQGRGTNSSLTGINARSVTFAARRRRRLICRVASWEATQ